jgi:DDE superfamily endonuclease
MKGARVAVSQRVPRAVGGVFSKDADVKPQQSRSWLHHDRAADPQPCDPDVPTIGAWDHRAHERHAHGVQVGSTDEQTGLQATDRAHATQPMPPGRVERMEFDSIRQGTQTLSANGAVATGPVMAPAVGPTRTEEEFVGPMERTMALEPTAAWVFSVDRRNTHHSASLVHVVAKPCGIEEDLGVKGKAGI